MATTYLVTGATGFIGRRVLRELLDRGEGDVYVLTRAASVPKVTGLAQQWGAGDRVIPLVGDIAATRAGQDDATVKRLHGRIDHLVHLAALYDMTAGAAANEAVNVDGTRHVVDLAGSLAAGCLHYVSSVAVAGDARGVFTEEMFDEGQRLPSDYHATKFSAEQIVRSRCPVPWRVYRPAVVVGDSVTGEMDKIDGPYYFLPTIRRVARLTSAVPRLLPVPVPDLGATNVVPVDYVARAMVYLMHQPDLDSRTFHLVNPEPQPLHEVYNAFARVAGAPTLLAVVPASLTRPALGVASALTSRLLHRVPGASLAADAVLASLGIPAEVIPYATFAARFDATETLLALEGSGVSPPPLAGYAEALWRYWEGELDPNRFRQPRPGGPLAGRTVLITGASSGIGRETARLVAARGGVPLLVARSEAALAQLRDEITAEGSRAYAYPCDLTDAASLDGCVQRVLAEHGGVDMLVNNAGRSIRRSVRLSYDRMHDYERTMALNYFAPVRLILGLLPQMTARRFGHVVNVSSIGVQANPPRFSAYVASKAALDAFSRVVASETFGEGVTFTTVHMPLVRTPMIAPTRIYDTFPTISPEEAAEMVVRALAERPKEIGTPLGTVAEVSYAVAPKAVDAVLHAAFRLFPDSTAAGGTGGLAEGPVGELSAAALSMARLLRGVHW